MSCYFSFHCKCGIFTFRVGGKDKPTRFLSYVEAVQGFRHLLQQEDLDRAMSLCTSLKGHLKSKFLCLSDDRILPPYQPKGGKRSHPDGNSQDSVPVKRTHQDHPPRPASTAGASGLQSSMSQVSAFVPSMSYVPQAFAGVSGVQPITVFPMTQAHSFMTGQMSVPPPQIVHPLVVPGPAGAVVSVATSQSPSFKIVQSRNGRGRGKSSANSKNPDISKPSTGNPVGPGRLTPSRAAKTKKPIVTSPGPDQYASCEESGEEEPNADMEEVQEVQE